MIRSTKNKESFWAVFIFLLSENPCLVMNFLQQPLLATKVSRTAESLFLSSNIFLPWTWSFFTHMEHFTTLSVHPSYLLASLLDLSQNISILHFPVHPSSRCLLHFVKIIFSKFSLHSLTRWGSTLHFSTADLLLFSIANLTIVFFNSIVNALLFSPVCDINILYYLYYINILYYFIFCCHASYLLGN